MSSSQPLRIACGQITWRHTDSSQEQILSEIAEAGYDGAPTSTHDESTIELFTSAGLRPAPGYLGAALWDAEQTQSIVEKADAIGRAMQSLGCTEVFVAANLTPERRALAGHVSSDDMLDDEGFRIIADTLNQVGRATLKHGVRACFHNHVGSFIETREEIDRLFSLVDRSVVFHGPDLGHLAWAGDDVLSLCQDYATDIKSLHIKDIDPQVLASGVAAGWDYSTFSDKGIFTELGEGFVDFRAAFDALANGGFDGWVVVETDVTQKATALESARISRNYLRSIGM